METVGDRLAKAQASGDLNGIRQALLDAKAAGAAASEVEPALAEVARLEAEKTAKHEQEGGYQEAAAAAAAAASEAASKRTAAEAHKKRGNEKIKEGTKSAAREALECFGEGLEVRCSDNVLNAQLYSNSAHVRILLKQLVEAVDDCRKAIELDPQNMKSYWRAAKASMNMDLHKSGMEFCDAGLRVAPKDADLIKMRGACAEKLAEQQRRKSELVHAASSDFNADDAMAVQDRVNEMGEQVESLKRTIVTKQRELQRNKHVRSSIAEMPTEQRVFELVGRCFVHQETPRIDEKMDSSTASLEQELPRLSKTLQELEKRKEESDKELKEMIQAFRQRAGEAQA